ncbi:carbonic anhydrase 2-like isoform X2 [Haematobia irritans]|uniref:carbonic anhydrase 2-like isoform X2 n=1 Tax=Haematobia irritans TaxID=7368 RepID=UPI003F4F49AD
MKIFPVQLVVAVGFILIMAKGNSRGINSQWTHQDQAKWYDNYPECSLRQQSPIEINDNEVIKAYFMLPIKFQHYSTPCPKAARLTNTGHTVETVLSTECPKPQITGGPLLHGNSYEVEGFHFHWGSQNMHGSEHIVNGKRYSMEAHIVHRNVKYPTVEEARKHSDGLAVLAIFYEVQNSNRGLVGLKRFVKALNEVKRFNSTTKLRDFRLTDLMGDIKTNQFYTYQGSLTTPPCSQAVTWIIFPKVLHINLTQMKPFRQLSNARGGALVNNYRFLQPKGRRDIYLRLDNLTMVINDEMPPRPTPGPYDDYEIRYDW